MVNRAGCISSRETGYSSPDLGNVMTCGMG